jgi:glucose-6-phosphate isomerase
VSRPFARQTEAPGALEDAYHAALKKLIDEDAVTRIAARGASLWQDDPAHAAIIRNRLGWLDAPAWLRARIAELKDFSADVRGAGFTRILLLGMGGSSLAPEVLQRCLVPGPGAPTLDVLDSTDPAAVAGAEAAARLDRTFFLVASKSGSTIETRSQYRYFRSRVEASGLSDPGARFAAITDEGSALQRLAEEEGFRRVFLNPSDIGGRYSALSYFGMAPGALLELDLDALTARAEQARIESLSPVAERNGALRLGALLGAAARGGRDKLTLLTSPALRPLGYWIEQLIAESTGKSGTGLVPIEGEPLGPAHRYGADRVFVSITLAGEPEPNVDRLASELTRAGVAWVRIELPDRDQIAGEFFRWEMATAVAGAVLGINPFDEPNVQESKDRTQEILAAFVKTGTMPSGEPRARDEGVEIYANGPLWEDLTAGAPAHPSLEMVLHRFLALARPGEYLSLLGFVERTAGTEAAFALMRRAIRNGTRVPVLQGYGPRYLHSIGQLYKGGPKTGVFLIITSEDEADVSIPGSPYSFGQLKQAQALGDVESLSSRGKPVVRVHLTQGVEAGLGSVGSALERALVTTASGSAP